MGDTPASQQTIVATSTSAPAVASPTLPGRVREPVVLIGEYDQGVGSVCLFVVPDISRISMDFQRVMPIIMARDYHPKNEQNDPIANFTKDTKIMTSDPKEDATYYIHRFHLFDIQARGNLRQLYLCYVSYDAAVIHNRFSEFTSQFSKVVEMLKRGNLEMSLQDMLKRLHNLRITAKISDMCSTKNMPPLEAMKALGIEPTPETLEIVKPSPSTEPRFDADGNTVSVAPQVSEIMAQITEIEKLLEFVSKAQNCSSLEAQPIWNLNKIMERGLRSLSGITGVDNLEKAMAHIKNLYSYFSRPGWLLSIEEQEKYLLEPPSLHLSLAQSIGINFDVDALDFGEEATPNSPGPGRGLQITVSEGQVNATTNSYGSLPNATGTSSTLSMSCPSNFSLAASSNAEPVPVAPTEGASTSTLPHHEAKTLFLFDIPTFMPPKIPQQQGTVYISPSMRTQSFANYFYQPSGLIPGANLLDISKSCPHLKHAVFSLLKGRTLVVRGKNIEEVKKTVNALSIFVPGGYNSEYGVIPLRTSCTLHPEKPVKCPIHIQELTHLRLVGVESSDPLVVGVQRNVSILSLDTQELIAPKYPRIADNRVQLIEELLGIRVDWPSESAFLAHIHRILLSIATKAYLYYHLCCVSVSQLVPERSRSHSSSNPPIPDWRNSQESLHHSVPDYPAQNAGVAKPYKPKTGKFCIKKYRCDKHSTSDTESFFNRYDIQPGDREIIMYLAEIIKKQQDNELNPKLASSASLDLNICTLFKWDSAR